MIICGTGHRPDKLGGYGEDVKESLNTVAMEWLTKHKVDRIISGGALGWDQALAMAAWDLGIPYTMALPFLAFDSKWPQRSRDYLTRLINDAHDVVYVCDPGYAPWKMQERNKWMVDNSDSVLALWNGTLGGTANCIKYAEKVGKPVTNLWSQYKGYTEHDPRDFFNEDFDGMDMP